MDIGFQACSSGHSTRAGERKFTGRISFRLLVATARHAVARPQLPCDYYFCTPNMHLRIVCDQFPPAPHGGTGSSYRDLAHGLVVGYGRTVAGNSDAGHGAAAG